MTDPLVLLRDDAGAAALAAAERLLGTPGMDALAAATALRGAGYRPDLASVALTQAGLRRRAAAKFGPDAARMYFTAAGIEQATRAAVAQRRARRLAAHGVRRVADLGCGVGADTLAFARAGLRVLAIEADPTTAAVAEANAAALGLADSVEVRVADATTVDLSEVDAVFCDPARREGGRRVFDPSAYSPPWSFVEALPARVPATVLKVAPGLDHALIPNGAEATWISVDGDVVEATIWCGPLAAVPRRATLLRGGTAHELTGTGQATAPVGSMGPWLYDPDGAVVRAHLVAEFADSVHGRLADPRIAYVFADRRSAHAVRAVFRGAGGAAVRPQAPADGAARPRRRAAGDPSNVGWPWTPTSCGATCASTGPGRPPWCSPASATARPPCSAPRPDGDARADHDGPTVAWWPR